MNVFGKVCAAIITAFVGLASVTTVSQAQGAPYYCGAYNPIPPVQCIVWVPVLLPGATWCSGDPIQGQVNIYQGINYQGTCETLSVNTTVPDASAVGWNNVTNAPIVTTLRIASFKTGPHTALNIYPQASYRCPVGGPCGASYGSTTMYANPDATKLYNKTYPTIGSFSTSAM